MNMVLSIVEFAVAGGFLVFAWRRWVVGQQAAAVMCVTLAIYFGRLGVLYGGRWLEMPELERAITPEVVFVNALLLLLALGLAIAETFERRTS